MKGRAALLVLVLLTAVGIAHAQVNNPVVQMTATLPDGQTKTLSAPESGLTTTTLANGAEYGFRPTIIDAKPWTHVVVTIFKMGTQSEYTQDLGEVDLKTGGSAATSKTTPSFKVAVTQVMPPAS